MHIFFFIEVLQSCSNLNQYCPYFVMREPFIGSFSLKTRKTACIAKLNEKANFLLFFEKSVSIYFVHIFAVSSRKRYQIIDFFRHFCFISTIFKVKNFDCTKIDIFHSVFQFLIFWFPLISVFLSR